MQNNGSSELIFLLNCYMKLPLRGIIPPMVTPLLKSGEIDLPGLKNLIEHILAGGVHGLFILGTTGEGTSLSHRQRKQLVSEVATILKKQVPLLVCVSDTSINELLELANHSKQAGADVLVVAPPFYLPISQNEMQAYLEELAPKLPLPFLIYNMPSCTKMNLSLKTVHKAKSLGAIGIKDSSGDWTYMKSLLDEFENHSEFSIMTGSESHLHKTICSGGHGAVAGGANFFPALFVALYDACLSKNSKEIERLNKKIEQIEKTIYSVGDTLSKYIKGTKSTLSVMGICEDNVAQPIQRLGQEDRLKIKAQLAEIFSDTK